MSRKPQIFIDADACPVKDEFYRVFNIKFGNGNVVVVDGNKLTIAFDKAGEKRVVDSFMERA